MIELRRLRYFATLAEELHFGRAALRLHIAQSALSAQIKALEAELEVRLFARNKRSAIALTDAGKLFLDEARRTLDQAAKAELTARRAGRGELGHIEIGYSFPAIFAETFPRVLGDFCRTHPTVDISIHHMASLQQMRQLGEDRLDIGLISALRAYPAELEALAFDRLEVVIALPENHPAALRYPDAVPAAALADSTFIVVPYNDEGGFIRDLDAVAERGGFTPLAAHSTNDSIDALAMAQMGQGVAFLFGPMRGFSLPGLAYRKLADVSRAKDFVAVFRKSEKSPAVIAFIDALREAAKAWRKQVGISPEI